jgi:3D (Asp-Asp-Asp) domain-containing protein
MRFRASLLLWFLALMPVAAATPPVRHTHKIIRMEATAYSRDVKATSSGTVAHEESAAADPAILPMGSRIRVTDAGPWSGVYTITDTGSKVKGLQIDLFIASTADARQFGKKLVRVQVIETGEGKEDAREKDIPAAPAQR